MKNFQKIGILGGMGPSASANFYQTLVTKCQQIYHAEQDEDYPQMIINSLPIHGFDEKGQGDHEKILGQLLHGIHSLELAGADFLVMPCNTIHLFSPEINSKISIPLISLIDTTVDIVMASGIQNIAILSSQETKDTGLYSNTLKSIGLYPIVTNDKEQAHLNDIILHVMGGTQNSDDSETISSIISSMKANGAEGIILGCTELPLAVDHSKIKMKLFNSIEILAERSLEIAYSEVKFSS